MASLLAEAAIAPASSASCAWWPLGACSSPCSSFIREPTGCGIAGTAISMAGSAQPPWPLERAFGPSRIGNGKMERTAGEDGPHARARWIACGQRRPTGGGTSPSSGNRAFDDYRSETLQRLEEEQREFKEFLERLRFAKDRAEFDQFMSERRNRPPSEGPQSQPQA